MTGLTVRVPLLDIGLKIRKYFRLKNGVSYGLMDCDIALCLRDLESEV